MLGPLAHPNILNSPSDIVEALVDGNINLFEATQLSRLTAERLNLTPSKAREHMGPDYKITYDDAGLGDDNAARVIEQLSKKLRNR
jgi:hypothetical protein